MSESLDLHRHAPLLYACRPVVLECCPDFRRWDMGDVVIRCSRCQKMLGEARYKGVSGSPISWHGGVWSRTSLESPFVSIGLDMATGLPAFGLRARNRHRGATPTRGRASGRPPVREAKRNGAPRQAVVHCVCEGRQILDLPESWPATPMADSRFLDRDPVLTEIEWSYVQSRPPGGLHFPECPNAAASPGEPQR